MEKQNWTSIFVFHFSSSGRKWNSNSLNALRFSFSVAQKKKILSFFFVFVFFFSVYGIETDNLCVSGKMSYIKTLSAGFLSNRNILTRGLSLKSRLDIRIQRAVVYEALKCFVITKK